MLRLNLQTFDPAQWPGSTIRTRVVADATSLAGMYALVIAIGLSGWVRSGATGRVTTGVATVGVVLLTVALAAAF